MSAVQIACPAGGMLYGNVTVATDAAALTDEAPAKPLFRGVKVTNHHAQNFVYVGDADVTAENGFAVGPGDTQEFPVDDPRTLYVISAAGGEAVSWWAI